MAQTPDDLANFAAALPDKLIKDIRQKGHERYLQDSAQILFSFAPDGAMTRESLRLMTQMQLAEQRARHLMLLLRYDLDGDFRLSRKEYESQMTRMEPGAKAQIALLFAMGKPLQSGQLTLEDMASSFQGNAERGGVARAESLLAFDYSGNGAVDLGEIAQVIQAMKGRKAPDAPPTALCTLPEVMAGDRVVLLSGDASDALSNVALDGADTPTFAATITIEKGDAPLYVFAASQRPMLWNFTGATKRIRKLVVQRPSVTTVEGAGAAVAGLDINRVQFVEKGACLEKVPSRMGQRLNEAAALLQKLLNTRVATAFATPVLNDVILPLGDVPAEQDKPSQTRARYAEGMLIHLGQQTYRLAGNGMVLLGKDGEPVRDPSSDRTAIQDMVRIYPAGVVSVDPAALVAPGPVGFYQVLPGQAGLLQLLAEGRIEPGGDGGYRVISSIPGYPAGMKGMFSFAAGIAPPEPEKASSP